jgi:membrane-associated PAP2 superfamily phosphatase
LPICHTALAERPRLAPTTGVDCPWSNCRSARECTTVRTGCRPPLNNSSNCWRSREESLI